MSAADFSSSYFALFGLPESFALDEAQLKQQYRALQRQYHPDRFASASAAERRVAEQISGRINAAYATLLSPLQRAEYLLSQRGIARDEVETVKDVGFLQQQMELRERLEELDSDAGCSVFAQHIRQLLDAEAQRFVTAFAQQDFALALACVARMHFYDKLLHEVEALQARFIDDDF